ncbi:glycosyltransferase [Arthrobacter sp. B3I4]|uniref:glycosyltransferase n=1 Tax=Arthrobacter sp. B3I4 TaxID=3042267 RepID=UPI00278238F4|nr:glycosyltransferase [Arthrobacter sp. B3I4]MDQ0757273.1 UDP:flavonoid glycosyltransferase YjiC (YdhE family) [Arthrobacter sp. B3I4]
MSDFLFATLDAGGNLPPALGIGRELLRQGHRVRFLGHAQQAAAVESAGAEFIPYRHAAPLSPAVSAPAHRQFAAMLNVFGDPGIGRDLLEEARREPPDVAVVDCLLMGAIDAAAKAGLPHVVLVHSFFAFFDGPFRRGPMGAALAFKKLPPRRAIGHAERVLVCADPLLDPAGRAPGGPGERVVWSGAVVDEVTSGNTGTRRAGRPRVLASLSTTAFPGQQQVLQKILDAASVLTVDLVMTTGPAVDPASLSAPANATVHRYIEHTEIMPDCDAVIGHGGHATAMRALAHGLPMMILPMHPLMDQPLVGKVIRDAGAGVLLSRKSSPGEIGNKLSELLDSESCARAAAEIGTRLRNSAGARSGAQVLADVAGRSR